MSGDIVVEAGVPAPPRHRRPMVLGVAGVVALMLTAIVSFRWGSADSPAPSPTTSTEPTVNDELSTAEIYAALAPSVVTIEAVNPIWLFPARTLRKSDTRRGCW